MKGFLGTLIVGIGMVLLLFMVFYGREFNELWDFSSRYAMDNLSNSLFLVGLVTFCLSLVMLTNAANIFLAVGYTVKAFFARRRHGTYMEYYDYLKQKRRDQSDRTGPIAATAFFMSIAMISVSLYIAYSVIPT